jgi:predicted adenylyl cyclase CyaB
MDEHEIELKYRLDGPESQDRLRARLAELKAERGPDADEENVLYDDPAGSLGAGGAALRLRAIDGGPTARLTFKGPATIRGGVKSRREIELAVDDDRAARALLEALGYSPSVRYLKRREIWRLDGVEVALDTLVFGRFCEVEGPEERSRALADRLGLRAEQVETGGYPQLQRLHDAGSTGAR